MAPARSVESVLEGNVKESFINLSGDALFFVPALRAMKLTRTAKFIGGSAIAAGTVRSYDTARALSEGEIAEGTFLALEAVLLILGGRMSRKTAGPRRAAPTVSVPRTAVRTNAQLVDDIGTRAGQWAQRSRQQAELSGLTPRAIGTRQHNYAKRVLERYQGIFGDRGLSAEVRYFDRAPLLRGRTPKGSIRLDVVEGPLRTPTAVYDYKFGEAGLSTGRINQIRAEAGLSPNVPVIEVHKQWP